MDDASQRLRSQIHGIQNALVPLQAGNPLDPNAIASATSRGFTQLLQALTDLATDIDAVTRRLDALEYKN